MTSSDPRYLDKFIIKDSGERKSFSSGMARDTSEGKIRYSRCADGPMLKRWAIHLTKGAQKYKDVRPGVPNWTLASGDVELARFKESAFTHFMDWFYGIEDEDHAAATIFNMNGAEYVKERISNDLRAQPEKETQAAVAKSPVALRPLIDCGVAGGQEISSGHTASSGPFKPVTPYRDGQDIVGRTPVNVWRCKFCLAVNELGDEGAPLGRLP